MEDFASLLDRKGKSIKTLQRRDFKSIVRLLSEETLGGGRKQTELGVPREVCEDGEHTGSGGM